MLVCRRFRPIPSTSSACGAAEKSGCAERVWRRVGLGDRPVSPGVATPGLRPPREPRARRELLAHTRSRVRTATALESGPLLPKIRIALRSTAPCSERHSWRTLSKLNSSSSAAAPVATPPPSSRPTTASASPSSRRESGRAGRASTSAASRPRRCSTPPSSLPMSATPNASASATARRRSTSTPCAATGRRSSIR